MAHIPLDKVYLIALWLEALFYGINFVLFWGCLFVLTYRKRSAEINKVVVATAICQYLLSTADVSLGLERLITGFIRLRAQPDGPTIYFSTIPDPVRVARVLIITMNSVLADSILVWRCYHVWGKSWKAVAFPAVLVLATAVCGVGQGISFARARPDSSIFSPDILRWNTSLFATTLVTNLTGTGLIAFRVWTLLCVNSSGPAYYRRVFNMVIESGMIYSAVLVIGLGLYLTGSNAFYVVYEQFGQLTSIIPTTILLLVALKLTSNDIHSGMSKATASTLAFRNRRRATTRNVSMSETVDIVEIISAASYNKEYDLKIVAQRKEDKHSAHCVV